MVRSLGNLNSSNFAKPLCSLYCCFPGCDTLCVATFVLKKKKKPQVRITRGNCTVLNASQTFSDFVKSPDFEKSFNVCSCFAAAGDSPPTQTRFKVNYWQGNNLTGQRQKLCITTTSVSTTTMPVYVDNVAFFL